VGDGISVPVEETEEADEPSSSRIASGLAIVSNTGTSAGNLANLDLANDFCNSLMGGAEVGTANSVEGQLAMECPPRLEIGD